MATGVRGRAGLGRGLAPDRRGIDGGRIDRRLLGVAGAAVGSHRDGQQLGRGPRPGGADPVRVGDGRRLVPVENEPKAVTPAASAAAMTARTPSARSLGRRAGGGRGRRPPAASSTGVRLRAARPSPSSLRRAAAIAAALSASRRRPSSSIRPVERDPDALADGEPEVDRRRSSRRRSGGSRCWRTGSAAASSAMTSASASVAPARSRAARGRARRGPGRPGRGRRSRCVHAARQLTTCRPRPGRRGTARPAPRARRAPLWPGSPLPQFGVPSIT